jgi:hypothetical protein
MNRDELEHRRLDILKQMSQIRTMRRGGVSEQYLKVPHKGEKEPVMRGPYYLWQYWVDGTPVRQRLRTQQEVAAARREVAAHKEFERLCESYVLTSVALGVLERGAPCTADTEKKTPNLRSRRTRK